MSDRKPSGVRMDVVDGAEDRATGRKDRDPRGGG